MHHNQVGGGKGEQGRDATIRSKMAQVLYQRGSRMACQSFESASGNKRKVQVFHLKESNGFNAVQGGDERWNTRPCWSTPETV